ncbi:MAG: hypothetical protein Q9223_004799 [Gallowayella weberi]
MTLNLLDLPAETLLAIARYLNSSADYIHLSQSHPSIAQRLEDRGILTEAIKVSVLSWSSLPDLTWRSQRIAGYSRECELVDAKALSPLDALHSIYDRQQAISRARPASTVVLGDGQSFLYRQGLLAYVRDDLIRVLDVHSARRTEGVIDITVIGNQLLGTECKDSEVELLHLQDGLLTLIYHGEACIGGWTSWVLVIDVTQYELRLGRLSLVVDLWTSMEIIARNDRQHVCIVAPTGLSVSGNHREWVCRVWDIDNLPARPPTVQIPELAINEIGQALVFEVFDGFLYAISTQPSSETDEPNWVSHYTCLRFPLNHPHSSTLERIQIWRRHHREGPINDLWTDLQLTRDEVTGALSIIEARKEWTGGSSSQKRTWYHHRLPTQFSSPNPGSNEDEPVIDSADLNIDLLAESQPADLTGNASTDSPFFLAVPPADGQYDHGQPGPSPGLDQPPPYPRLPCNTQLEYPDTASSPLSLANSILARSRYRTYIPSAAAFLDLVVDDRPTSSPNTWTQQLRLRIGSRKESSPLDDRGMIHRPIINPYTNQLVDGSEKRYEDNGICSWPPLDAPAVLLDILNGNTAFRALCDEDKSNRRMLGDVTSVSDERSIIYLVKGKGAADHEKGQLILINFDQHIKFWHNKWAPGFIDLYGRHESDATDASIGPADEVSMENMAPPTYEPIDMEIDDPEVEGGGEDEDYDPSAWDGSQEENKFQPADDINDLFWCEEFDENEPVEMHWFMEQMALWTDFQEGFCFNRRRETRLQNFKPW